MLIGGFGSIGELNKRPIEYSGKTVTMKTYGKKVFKKISIKNDPEESKPLKKTKLKNSVQKTKKVNRKLEEYFEKQKEFFEIVDKEVRFTF